MKALAPTAGSLLNLNRISAPYGLSLTKSQALGLAESRATLLKENGRVEFGCGIYGTLIWAFCDSPYLDRETYAETLDDLQGAFERFKEEAEEGGDPVSSDELIDTMRTVFDGPAGGSVEKLTAFSCAELMQAADTYDLDFEPGLPREDPLPINRDEEEWLDAFDADGWDGETWEDDDERA